MMTSEQQLAVKANKLLGEYTGNLQGILAWEIPAELRVSLKKRITELEEMEFPMPDGLNTKK